MAVVPGTVARGPERPARRAGRPFQGRLSLAIAILLIAALGAQARRVISIIPATTEMLFAMGAGDRVIAIGSYDHFPPEAQKLPRVGALIDPNVEQILQMRPDLVVLYGTQTELRRRLERAGIPYYPYVHKGLSDITETMRSLGKRMGVEAGGNALADRVEKQLVEIRERVAKSPRPRTLLVIGREQSSLRNISASGGQGFLHDMLEAAGGTDVLADIHRQSVAMSTEMVLARAPDVIVELQYSQDGAGSEGIAAWNRLASVPAVKNHRVILLTGEEFVVPGPRVGAATRRLAAALHPELRW
jgi:iron complex transport system substrate-binding protein